MKKLKFAVPLSRPWRVSLGLMLLAALVLAGASCGEEERSKRKKDEDEEDEEEDKLKDYTLYENEKWNFKIYYPNDWEKEVLSEEADGIMLGFLSPQENEEDYFAENVIVLAFKPELGADFSELVLQSINDLQEDPYMNLVSSSQEMISGYPCYKIIYTETWDSDNLQYLHYLINANDTWYQILYTAEQATYSKFLEQVETMIDSFEILK